MDDWTNELFFNPFNEGKYFDQNGPNFLRLKINEDIRLKILDSIKDHLANEWEDKQVINGFQSSEDVQKNSIVDGKMGEVPEEWLKKHPENKIENTIKKLLCRYGEIIYKRPCLSSIVELWYVVMKSGDFHILHSHNQRELSGAIYLEIPDNLPDPQGNINWVIGGPMGTEYNPFWECSPEPGDVFLWPGWLMHTVYPFRSKQERIMISFNGQVV